MEGHILTPMQIWQNHNASTQPLQYRILNKKVVGNVCVMDICFSAIIGQSGTDRAFVKVAYPNGGHCLPAILYVPDFKQVITDKLVIEFASKGYAIFCIDLVGQGDEQGHCTKFSNEHSYGKLENAGERLFKAEPDARATCGYLWSVIARRTLTLMRRLYMVDKESISIIGNQGGANVMWQVAAFDARIKSAIAVNNAGKKTDFFDEEREMTAAEQKWLIGCAIPSYAKFLACPMLYVGSSNSDVTSIEKIWETLKLLPENTAKCRSISIGTRKQLELSTKKTVFEWLEMTLKKSKPIIENPLLKLSCEDANLVAEVDFAARNDVAEVVLAVSEDNTVPQLKNWIRIPVDISKDNWRANIDVFSVDKKMLVFANVYLKDGSMWTTRLRSVVIDENYALKPLRKSRILYDRKMGTAPFFSESQHALYEDRLNVAFRKGALDIVGIGTKTGNLFTYQISEERFRGEDENILQFDAYCEEPTEIAVEMWTEEDGEVTVFATSFKIETDEWTKVSLQIQDFKDGQKNSLKTWHNIKKMNFVNVPKVLFGNFLWV